MIAIWAQEDVETLDDLLSNNSSAFLNPYPANVENMVSL